MNDFKLSLAGAFLLAVVGLVGCTPTPPPTTENLTWTFENAHPSLIQLEFYSQSRNAAWPGGGLAYELRSGDTRSVTLACRSGEQICFGAWIKNRPDSYWGSGMDDTQPCTQCCARCRTTSMSTITLAQ